MTELQTKTDTGFLQVAENLIKQMKGFAYDIADVKDEVNSHSKAIEELVNTSEITTNQRMIIQEKVKAIVNRDLTRPTNRRRSIAYPKVYNDMRVYGLAKPYSITEKRFFDNIVEALNCYQLDVSYVDDREEKLLEEER